MVAISRDDFSFGNPTINTELLRVFIKGRLESLGISVYDTVPPLSESNRCVLLKARVEAMAVKNVDGNPIGFCLSYGLEASTMCKNPMNDTYVPGILWRASDVATVGQDSQVQSELDHGFDTFATDFAAAWIKSTPH